MRSIYELNIHSEKDCCHQSKILVLETGHNYSIKETKRKDARNKRNHPHTDQIVAENPYCECLQSNKKYFDCVRCSWIKVEERLCQVNAPLLQNGLGKAAKPSFVRVHEGEFIKKKNAD